MLLLCAAQIASVVYLEDLDLSGMSQGWGSPNARMSVDNNPLTIKGVKFAHGVGTHAESRMQVRLNGGAASFHAMVGVDDETAGRGSVTFQVIGDGKTLAQSSLLKANDPAATIDVDLKRVKVVTLVVTDGGDDMNYDHADWADASFSMVKGKPSTVVVAPEPPMKIASGVSSKPEIHGARVVGCSPNAPFLFKVPATGAGPLSYEASGLPSGLMLDSATGIISGRVSAEGESKATVTVSGPKGKDSRSLRIVCGTHQLALTPPMGWNSWNIWGTSVDAQKVRDSADAFIKAGLADYGYQYVNIDDAWEGQRDANGEIVTNNKFGDMGALADYVHSKGLKLGIYSSPGPKTCAGYEGTYQHEVQDAKTYGKWGIDYLKYDWCSYGNIAKDDSLYELQKPYMVIRDALDQAGRDIVLSLCQYGMGDVFNWGKRVGGNLWRTTGDITDTWQSMSSIAFSHSPKAIGVSPGGWNDPDMLVVGKLGWGPNPRPTHLTPNEQITHITMWAMLAAPLIIGCDLTQIDQFTKDLLTNHDVIEIDQDPLGKAATFVVRDHDLEIWSRPLADGTMAVAMFNRGPEKSRIWAAWPYLRLHGPQPVYNCWERKSMGTVDHSFSFVVPAHGAAMFKVGKPNVD